MSRPAVSVIVPAYNRAGRLPATIDSVLGQTMPDFELIVVDDGSTDDTPAVLGRLMRQDKRIRAVANTGRHGPGPARNAGIAEARAEWVAFLDSDDLWKAEKLARFLAAAAPDVVMIGSDYEMVDEERGERHTMRGIVIDRMVPWWQKAPLAAQAIDCARLKADASALAGADMMVAMTIGGFLWPQTSSVMARRSALDAAGGFDPALARTEDMDMWLKLIRLRRVAYVDEVLAQYDISGRENATGERYATHDPSRRHSAYREAVFHLRFLQALPRRAALDAAKSAYLRERTADHRRLCGRAARRAWSPMAIWHYALALACSAEHRRQFRRNKRSYLRGP